MEIIVYLLGITLIAYCTYFNLYPRHAAKALESMFQNYPLKYLAAIPAVVSVLFLVSAPASLCPWPFVIIGIMAAIEAVVAFTNPNKIYTRILDWLFDNVSDQAYRLFSILGIILGTWILTLAK